MSDRSSAAMLSVVAVVAICAGGFFVVQQPLRHLETVVATRIVNDLGAERAHMVLPTSIQVFPMRGEPFRAVITPACSSGGSLLAISSLAALVASRSVSPRRRLAALAASLAAVWTGNIVRIASSVGVGFVFGRPSLVLFHDWVGSLFTFGYTLGGFILFLFLSLPSPAERSHADVAVAA